MSRLVRHVGRFLLLFTLALGVLTPLWGLAAPYYGRLAAGAARPLFHAVESPNVTVVDVQGGELWILRRLDDRRVTPFLYFDRYTFFAVIPLIALFAATPGLGVRRRAVRGLAGLAMLFVLQVGYLVAAVELAYVAGGLTASGGFLSRTSEGWQILVRVLWEAGPVVIWIALTASEWRRLWGGLRAPEPALEARARGTAAAGSERG
jgi:hypothetical protein